MEKLQFPALTWISSERRFQNRFFTLQGQGGMSEVTVHAGQPASVATSGPGS
ncbi:hypothetical protein [Corallococcus sp. EGB]|uniref:hypothetical protein n=1 Tax=Corallococcus sp. EGB TaxID=1521117 RepID=UPI001CC13BD3|nr:hypothetical protein [Corallococcus sp. EGB]